MPLPDYASDRMMQNQGIVAYATLRDGTIAFLVGEGRLYTLQPTKEGSGRLSARGFMHPEGPARIKTLFSHNGESLLVSIAENARTTPGMHWLIHELESGVSATKTFVAPLGGFNLIYGSMTRDDNGAFYVAGSLRQGSQPVNEPLLLRLVTRR